MSRAASDGFDLSSLGLKPAVGPAPTGLVSVEDGFLGKRRIFSHFGPRMAALGWSVFPQQRSGQRKPGLDRPGSNALIRWSVCRDGVPDDETIERWAQVNPDLNVAVALGPASGGTFALDVDVLDERLSFEVQQAAHRVLGRTPFVRYGKRPKAAMIYRYEGEAPANKTFRFVGDDGEPSDDMMLEILGDGKALTFHGVHHSGLHHFQWSGSQPSNTPPAEAPCVSEDALDAFLSACAEIRPIATTATAARAADWDWKDAAPGDARKPRLRQASADWTEDADGRVRDGREKFLASLAFVTTRLNAPLALSNPTSVYALVHESFHERAVVDGRWANDGWLRREIAGKVDAVVAKLRSGDVTPLHDRYEPRGDGAPARAQRPKEVAPTRASVGSRDSLSFIPRSGDPTVRAVARTGLPIAVGPRDEAAAETRRLSPDRTEAADAVGRTIEAALDAFLTDVTERVEDGAIHLLRAPTGAGKTTRTLARIAEDPRTKRWDDVPDGERPGPLLFLMPTYANIEELRERAEILNLDPEADDEELERAAREVGLLPADGVADRLSEWRAQARAAGLRTMVYKGKVAAGCAHADKMEVLTAASVGTAGLCKQTVVRNDGEREEVFCEHYQGCPAILQRKALADCHLVFLPHAFMALDIPEELQRVRGVVVDERVFPMFVHTTSFPLRVLQTERRRPPLTKREKAADLDPDDLIQDRNKVAHRCRLALLRGDCPGLEIHRMRDTGPRGERKGIELVDSALKVVNRAISAASRVDPEMSLETLVELCSRPTGTHLREESRFWSIVRDRAESLARDELAGSVLRGRRAARGDRDARVQLLVETLDDGAVREDVRVSWRTAPQWPGAPYLLLDASADPRVVAKIFGGRDVVRYEVDVPLNVRCVAVVDRTYAASAIVGAKDSPPVERARAARLKDRARKLISTVSGLYGWGRVVVGSSVAVRKSVCGGWYPPTNVDFTHYGAMRGLDFAKGHVAAVSVGRMELPVATVDGIVAALTYDDDEPEAPFDVLGTGTTAGDLPLRLPTEPRTVPMRGGEDVTVHIPRYPGRWARIVQEQYREEELRQFLGRLRPVYREGEAPVWFAVSRILPEGVVVDDVVGIDDLLLVRGRAPRFWDAVRKCGGILHPRLAADVGAYAYDGADDVVRETAAQSISFETGRVDPLLRATWGLVPVRLDGDATGYAFALSSLPDPAAATREAFAVLSGLEVDVEVGEPCRLPERSRTRPPDWVETSLGTPDERRVDERRHEAEAARQVVSTVPPDRIGNGRSSSVPVRFAAGHEGRMADTSLVLSERAAWVSTDEMWSRTVPKTDVVDPSAIPRSDRTDVDESF